MSEGLLALDITVGIIAILAGLIIKLWLDSDHSNELQITWSEFAVGSLIVVPIIMLVVGGIGWKLGWSNVVSYNEYWNGWEISAEIVPTECGRDGACVHEYSCDPYLDTEYYDCNCDDDGCDRCSRTVTKYHSCPFATRELTTVIHTTLGDYTIDSNIFEAIPTEWRFGSEGNAWPNVQRGPSQFWLNAKARCDAGQPGPVTKRMPYDNLLLASDKTNLKAYSAQIQQYKDAGVMPTLQFGIRDFYYADKVYFVGFNPPDRSAWETVHAYLNSGVGDELTGDLHLILVQSDLVTANPDAHLIAVKASWQNPAEYGKDALSKNGIIIEIGTIDGVTAAWGRAITGMPLGNEMMITEIKNVKGTPMTPEALIGVVRGEFYQKIKDDGSVKTKVRTVGDQGFLRQTLWGLVMPDTAFVRQCMICDDEGDTGTGFTYLANEIEPTTGQKWMIGIIAFIFCMVGWYVFAQIGDYKRRYRSRW